MKKKIVLWLEAMRKEAKKRDGIYKYGVDLINYENEYEKVALQAVVYFIFMMNKKFQRTEEQIKEDVEWWIWEDVKKEYTYRKRKYNVESAKDFINFLLKH